jgi:protein-tyrosine phosphatase
MRSCTAEVIYNSEGLYTAKSAGTERTARVKITKDLLLWADIIFTMEEKQAEYIRNEFIEPIRNKKIIVLGIPNNHYFMEPALIKLITNKVDHYLVI